VSHLIGLDLGTTTVTGVLFDAGRDKVLRLAQRRNDTAPAKPALPTRAAQYPDRLYTLALEVLAELAEERSAVHGISLTGQKHGLLCVDAANRPLTPLISWQDQRTAEPLPGTRLTTLDQLQARLDDLDWQDNGCRIAHGYGAATLFWLIQQGQLSPATHRACTIAGWLAGQLTGQPPATDPTFAASWGIYSLAEDAWNVAFLDRLGIEAQQLPPVLPSGETLGGLLPEVARQVGLPAGIPIGNALGDTQASFLGACLPQPVVHPGCSETGGPGSPVRDESPERARSHRSADELAGAIFLNIGTGGQICWMVPRFQPPTGAVETRPLLPGRYLCVGASLCGGAAYAWLNRTVRDWLSEFEIELEEDTVYERLNTLAAECEPQEELRVRPTFLGARGYPSIQAGAIEGITLSNMQLGALARATLVGIVDELYALHDTHASQSTRYREVVAAGGGVQRNPLMPSLIEARFGLPVRTPAYQEPAAVGAVLALEIH
jgi:sugar (pentulose or hexulose) kinase